MQAVFVTGASTGIGYAVAARLARSGFAVFAGCRKESDAQRIARADGAIRPLLVDVQDARQVADAARAVEAFGIPLRGIVNNAGIAVAGPLEYLPIDELRRQFEVNVFGAIAVTQAFLPQLRAARGRIVFVSSVSGQLAPPYLGPYAASKFALEAFADSLRMELAPFGIAVSVVQPGNVKTPIWAKGRAAKDELVARLPGRALHQYGAAIDALVRITEREERTGIEADAVAEVILKALTAAKPKARYPVGPPAGWMRRCAALLPETFRDRLILRNFRK